MRGVHKWRRASRGGGKNLYDIVYKVLGNMAMVASQRGEMGYIWLKFAWAIYVTQVLDFVWGIVDVALKLF